MVIELVEWSAFELSKMILSDVDCLSGCGAICEKDVPGKINQS